MTPKKDVDVRLLEKTACYKTVYRELGILFPDTGAAIIFDPISLDVCSLKYLRLYVIALPFEHWNT